MNVPLHAQAIAVERAAANLRGHVDNLVRLVAAGKRPVHELETARAWLPDLEDAAATLRELVEKDAA